MPNTIPTAPELKIPNFRKGSVWVAGAGPGAPEMLTLGALHAIQTADTIVYDALVNRDILKLASESTTLEYAGKRGGKPSPKQQDITLRLIELARQKRKVLRLKGGDPFVFGRGGEEIAGLIEAGIPFRILPGITAATGGLASVGIPLTHRDVNQCFAMITGHDAQGNAPGKIDWHSLARAAPVLVFYMVAKHLPTITEKLIQAGRAPSEPAALLQDATLSAQTFIATTLGTAVRDAQAHALKPPALFVVGEVVRRRLVSPPHGADDDDDGDGDGEE